MTPSGASPLPPFEMRFFCGRGLAPDEANLYITFAQE